ncbi:MAG: hypothetical protein Q8N17_25900 [Burkholderiaceae bacterium]|nr:hypothetical protein [Burkholderiaceae bacterium]
MIFLNAVFSQQHAPDKLPAAVRAVLGKPLHRANTLTQLALIGALTCLPKECRHLSTALLWQSSGDLHLKTPTPFEEVCRSQTAPIPHDLLTGLPTIAAMQIQAFLPGLESTTHIPLTTENEANWSLLLTLASNWLNEGRYAQVLCAYLDSSAEPTNAHWLLLANNSLENSPANLHIRTMTYSNALPDTPDFPVHLAQWLTQASSQRLHLQSAAMPRLAVEFAQI